MKNKAIDVKVEGGMGFYLIRALTAKAKRWVKKNVSIESYQVQGDGFVCDGKEYAMDIAAGMTKAGLTVR